MSVGWTVGIDWVGLTAVALLEQDGFIDEGELTHRTVELPRDASR